MPVLPMLAMFLLCGCLIQESAPVLLKGEKFYGSTDDSSEGYHLSREYVGNASTSPSKPASKILIGEASRDLEEPPCDFMLPLSGKVIPVHTMRRNSVYKATCTNGVAIVDRKRIGEIAAASEGRVLYIGRKLQSYGNMVIVEHDKYTVTMYYHLGDINVKIGDTVKRGDALAKILEESSPKGSSKGDTHFFCFSMRKNGELIDPVQYLKECKAR